ncbi:MAG: SulP family inorganic anion transporter [Acidimicrobiia bacterium]|nr:SulP family inorganic anion transporter [Acidimicrobiia bacterium]
MVSIRALIANVRRRAKRSGFDLGRETVRADARAGLVLGVESVPDGLASGILAGVNPVAGLYAYMFGVTAAAFFTSTTFMAVQGTGAMAIIVADVDIESFEDPTGALVTLSVLTGVIMLAAGYLRAGIILRFVPNAVMTGFISAVGVNIVLGQLGDFTGYESSASNRVTRAVDLLFHFWRIDLATITVGLATIILIVGLRRTRLGAMGLVVAIVAGSILAAVLIGLDEEIVLVGNVAEVPNRLPTPMLPRLADLLALIVPAFSLAFVGLVQGAGASAAFTNPDGSPSDASQDFVGQGVGNVTAGLFQGMPVGGSMSASSLVVSSGAKSRLALVFTGGVMAIVILLFAGAVEHVAMPALAGLLIVIGIETVKPHEMATVYKTGAVQATVMPVTFVLTLLIPLQFAVLVGVGISVILFVIRQSNQLTTRRLIVQADERIKEVDPPHAVQSSEVIVLQPYGSLFFASAPAFEEQLPTVTESSTGSVVVVRFRGKPDVGSTLIDVLERYARSLNEVGSKLVIVTNSDRIIDQLEATGAAKVIGRENIYRGGAWLSETVVRASREGWQWVEEHRADTEGGD